MLLIGVSVNFLASHCTGLPRLGLAWQTKANFLIYTKTQFFLNKIWPFLLLRARQRPNTESSLFWGPFGGLLYSRKLDSRNINDKGFEKN